MAHDANRLARRKEGLDELDRSPVLGQIRHWPMTARIEHGVELFLPDAVNAHGLVELRFRGRVLLETQREISAEFGFVALGVKRRPSTLRGCEPDLGPDLCKGVVGSCE